MLRNAVNSYIDRRRICPARDSLFNIEVMLGVMRKGRLSVLGGSWL